MSRKPWPWPTTPATAWLPPCGPLPQSAPGAWPPGLNPGRWPSTASSRPIRACPAAASSGRALAASWARTAFANLSMPSRCGLRKPAAWRSGAGPVYTFRGRSGYHGRAFKPGWDRAVGAKQFTARAGANIALIKYWGKRNARLNLPAAGSLSITLANLETTTTVVRNPALRSDELVLNGRSQDAGRVTGVLDLMRVRAGRDGFCRVESHNSFPTAAGLASSASGFAALVVAAAAAFDLTLSPARLSELARRGSGSVARSIFV